MLPITAGPAHPMAIGQVLLLHGMPLVPKYWVAAAGPHPPILPASGSQLPKTANYLFKFETLTLVLVIFAPEPLFAFSLLQP